MKKLFFLLTTSYFLLTTSAFAQNPVTAPEVRIPGKAQNQVRRIQKPMTGVLFYRLSDSTMCVRNPDNSVTPLSGGGSGDYSPWDTTATAIIQKDTTLNVGIGTVSPDFNLHVAGSFFAEKTVGGRTVHMWIDTFVGFTQIFNEFTSGDTSNVMGVTPGDVYMRANTDGTDYDVIMNISDPAGVKIQGKSTTTGNALTILEGDTTIFGGDTLYRFGNNGTMQVYGMAGSAQKIVTADATGVLDTAINLLAFNIDGDGNMYAGTDALAALTSGALNFAAGINAGAIIEDGAGNTIIGNEATVQSANTSAAVSIGYQANAGENAISIGYTSQAQALASIALGEYSAISPGHTYSIALGLNATTTEAKQFFITDSILHTSFKGELVCRDKTINTTAGDAATINAIAGRFRKDNSGATFTLTDSYITANSIIQITPANAVIDATATTWTVSAGVGSATITFNLAPTANFDMNFFIIN